MQQDKYSALELKNQICFPLYAVSNKIIRKYRPLLKKLDLTYTQYLVMLVLWEKKKVNEKELCGCLRLGSNTLAPLLKKLESKGYISRSKDKQDGRNLTITLTSSGKKLKEKATAVPVTLAKELNLTPKQAQTLYTILYEILDKKD